MLAAFLRAAFDGDVDALKIMLAAGVGVDAADANGTALHAAIENDQLACVRLLVESGADIERQTYGGLTPLAHAVDVAIDGTIQNGGMQGDEPVEIIEYLLDAGADPAPGLAVALTYRSAKVVELLQRAQR